jgi:hypothetical protein
MKNTKLETILAIAAGFLIIWLLIDNNKKKNKIKELHAEIDDNQNLTIEIKKKLKELIENNTEIDPKIAKELGQIVGLLEIKQDTTAIFKLAKIIENLLQELYEKDPDLKILAQNNGRKKPVFAEYLEHAKNKKILSAEDFHLLSILKIIRNEEAHELDVKKEKSRMMAVFISGISLILWLCRLLKKKSLEEE